MKSGIAKVLCAAFSEPIPGYADFASDRVPDADTLFRCGSITKTFTATTIMQLRDEGKLAIDDPIASYIPEFWRGKGIATVTCSPNHQ